MYYFAFGSNLSHEQMKRRCPSSKFIGCGALDGFKLSFVGYSQPWESSTANVLPSVGSKVRGALYTLSETDADYLSSIEAKEAYFPEKHEITHDDGSRLSVVLYRSEDTVETAPGPRYVAVMERGKADCKAATGAII